MNTTDFSQFLKTLLDEVHSRAVEQYSKSEVIRDGATVALAAQKPPVFNSHLDRFENDTWTTCSQSFDIDKQPKLKPSYTGVGITCNTHTPEVNNVMVRPPSIRHSATSGFFLERSETWCLDRQLSSVSETDVGHSVSLPGAISQLPSTPRNSLLAIDSGTDFLASVANDGWVINPESKAMRYWDGITIMAMAFVALVSPVQVALMETQLDFLFMLNCIIDCIFIVDMILQFFLMYYVNTGHGTRLEYRQPRIVEHYVKTWFLVDLMSVLPFDLVALLVQSNDFVKAKGVKTIRILRMLKLMRMLKASRILQRLDMSLLITNTYQVFDLYMFVVYLILISHWLACLWAMTLSLVDDDSVRWVDTFDSSELGVEEKTKDSIWKMYVAALYFTAYTMTSVGYGDVTPANIVERIVCIIILFISGFVWACVIGQVTSILSNLDAHEQEFRSLMDNLSRMMKDRGLPRPVRKRLKAFFLSAKQAQRNQQQELILRRMSPVLQGEVALRSNWHWVKKVSFIYSIYSMVPETRKSDGSADMTRAPPFVVDIALALELAVFAQTEVFGEQRVLYILKQGLALSRARRGMRVFCVGDVWGEDFVLSKSLLRESEARLAMTYIETFQLTFSSFIKVCQRHSPSEWLRRALRRIVVRLSARRAILVEANWRRFAVADELVAADRSTLLVPGAP